MEYVKLENLNDVVIKQAKFDHDYAVAEIGNDGLYLVNRSTMTACRLPDEYQKMEVTKYPPRGGCSEGLVMVNKAYADKGERKALYGEAGLWGWVDTSFNEVIKAEYIYATNFVDGKAIVCKERTSDNATFELIESCHETWGIIDVNGNEIVSCKYDEINTIIGTNRYYLAHVGGWVNGSYCVVDSLMNREILKIDFLISPESIFSDRYMLNDDIIVFTERYDGEDYNYAYSISSSRYLQFGEKIFSEGNNELCLHGIGRVIYGGLSAAC